MVFQRPEGGFFTTEAPDRTYKSERAAKAAERMFQHPELWQGWKRENWIENQPPIEGGDEGDGIPETNPEPEEPEWDDAVLEPEDPFIPWYELPYTVRNDINHLQSDSACKNELLSNGWEGVHLSSIITDFEEGYARLHFPAYFD